MNLDRYEKINGREALKHLADGEHVFSKAGVEYRLNQYGFLYYIDDVINDWKTSRIAFNQLVVQGFYIPKPFDVRQAMLDRPNEWVGAYKSTLGTWYKVGFDSTYMTTIITALDQEVEATHDTDGVRPIFVDHSTYFGRDDTTVSLLDNCIPIEDVPEEAKR